MYIKKKALKKIHNENLKTAFAKNSFGQLSSEEIVGK